MNVWEVLKCMFAVQSSGGEGWHFTAKPCHPRIRLLNRERPSRFHPVGKEQWVRSRSLLCVVSPKGQRQQRPPPEEELKRTCWKVFARARPRCLLNTEAKPLFSLKRLSFCSVTETAESYISTGLSQSWFQRQEDTWRIETRKAA